MIAVEKRRRGHLHTDLGESLVARQVTGMFVHAFVTNRSEKDASKSLIQLNFDIQTSKNGENVERWNARFNDSKIAASTC